MDKIPVLVTGIGGGGHGEQIIKALRLGKLSYNIIGTDITTFCSSRAIVDKFYEIPLVSSSSYLTIILDICKKYKVKAVFHGSEQEMMFFSEHRKYFEDIGIYLPVNSKYTLDICQNKSKTMEHLNKLGFETPKFIEITKQSTCEFGEPPFIVKPSIGGGGSSNVFIAQDYEELRLITKYILKYSKKILIQEYIGTPDKEFTVGVLFGKDGHLINSIAVKRIIENALSRRMSILNNTNKENLGTHLVVSSGVSSGEIGRWSYVTKPCEVIAKSLKPIAPINIQCRQVNNKIIPFEINPRFSGTTSLRAIVGYNEPDVLIRRDVFGEEIKDHFSYNESTIMRGLQEYEI